VAALTGLTVTWDAAPVVPGPAAQPASAVSTAAAATAEKTAAGRPGRRTVVPWLVTTEDGTRWRRFQCP
jgi:hypothetical protein